MSPISLRMMSFLVDACPRVQKPEAWWCCVLYSFVIGRVSLMSGILWPRIKCVANENNFGDDVLPSANTTVYLHHAALSLGEVDVMSQWRPTCSNSLESQGPYSYDYLLDMFVAIW